MMTEKAKLVFFSGSNLKKNNNPYIILGFILAPHDAFMRVKICNDSLDLYILCWKSYKEYVL